MLPSAIVMSDEQADAFAREPRDANAPLQLPVCVYSAASPSSCAVLYHWDASASELLIGVCRSLSSEAASGGDDDKHSVRQHR